jgi:hypothetical protein
MTKPIFEMDTDEEVVQYLTEAQTDWKNGLTDLQNSEEYSDEELLNIYSAIEYVRVAKLGTGVDADFEKSILGEASRRLGFIPFK